MSYNSEKNEYCTGGEVIRFPKGAKPCGAYNYYYPDSHICCGDTVKNKSEGFDQCCENRPYKSRSQQCCNYEVVNIPADEGRWGWLVSFSSVVRFTCDFEPELFAADVMEVPQHSLGFWLVLLWVLRVGLLSSFSADPSLHQPLSFSKEHCTQCFQDHPDEMELGLWPDLVHCPVQLVSTVRVAASLSASHGLKPRVISLPGSVACCPVWLQLFFRWCCLLSNSASTWLIYLSSSFYCSYLCLLQTTHDHVVRNHWQFRNTLFWEFFFHPRHNIFFHKIFHK